MRLVSIDILRSLAIITMVIIHFVENLSSFYGADGSTLGRVWLPTGFAAPLFTFLSGRKLLSVVEIPRISRFER